jgi:outer membrane protein TolC
MSRLKTISSWIAAAAALLTLPCCAYAQDAASQQPAQPSVQLARPGGEAQSPTTLTLADAIARARKVDADYGAAAGAAKNAHEDALQARNAILPQVSATTQFLGTQGDGGLPNGIATGRFVTNDGVHVYRAWGVFKEDLSPEAYLATGYHHAQATEALAKAKAEIAQRGLTVTVTKNYYGLAAAQRKYAAAQDSLAQAQHFLKITLDAETAGQAAHSDVLKAQIAAGQQEQAFDEVNLAMENARLMLAVIVFPKLDENFTVVDDLDTPASLPAFTEMQDLAAKQNPDLRVAMETVHQANVEVAAAKGAFLPTFTVETDYGIEANAFALRSAVAADPAKGPLPNLGYFVTAGVTIPVWDWGTLRSKLHQSETNQEQARTSLSQSQRTALANLYTAYNEASVARAAVESSRKLADAAAESLRLTGLRYQAGESTAQEVVDSQNTSTQARTGYADAQVRYRVALATLQTFTGSF